MFCGPITTPKVKPLSWLGIKPVGMVKNRYTVPHQHQHGHQHGDRVEAQGDP